MVKEKNIEEKNEKKCNCSPDCKCGCQEGKECTCEHKGCCCHHDDCGCPCKRALGKIILLALVFFAGMGVNQFMNDTCFGRCPAKNPRMAPMMQAPRFHGNLPAYSDDRGNTIVIVNTGEENAHGCNCGANCKCGKHHKIKEFHKHHNKMTPKGSIQPAQ